MPRLLDTVTVASPCPASWAAMEGDERARFCAQCQLTVFDISALSADEAEAMLLAAGGEPVCGRLFRRADGTVLTKDCPIGLRARLRRRVASLASAAAALGVFVLGALGWRAASRGADGQGEVAPVLFGEDPHQEVMGRMMIVRPRPPVLPAGSGGDASSEGGASSEEGAPACGDEDAGPG